MSSSNFDIDRPGGRFGPLGFAALLGGALLLSGCSDTGEFKLGEFLQGSGSDGAEETVTRASTGGDLIERDVEAPEVFESREAGLWDGRPSLGGIWVAHPEVDDPERVLIRNATNDKFVVGALFRRERDIPGPRLQISSDAAEALGMLAGAPTQLEVVALRKEEVPAEPVFDPAFEPVEAEGIDAAEPIQTASLDPLDAAAAALDEPVETAAAAAPAATPLPTPAAPAAQPAAASGLKKPFLQIGIFSVEANAERSADIMRNAGVIPTVKRFDRDGKPFWRVVVGPAQSTTERADLLAQIKKQGFSDAYAVTN